MSGIAWALRGNCPDADVELCKRATTMVKLERSQDSGLPSGLRRATVFTAFSVSHTNYERKISEWKQHLVCRTLLRNMAHY